ncbi:Ig-like domain-containing protein [Kaarinaea lacus]
MRNLLVNSSSVFGFVKLCVLLALGMTGIIGSGGDDITGPGNVTLTSITIAPSAIPDGLPVGLTQQFTATAAYSNNTQQDVTSTVTWSSSDTGVATIGVNNGIATGVADGSADISASLSGVASNVVSLSVITLTLNKIEISPAIMPDDLPLGINQQFIALGTFDNYKSYDITGFVTWSSSNQSFATINSNGLVTSVAAGPTNITASALTVTSNSVSVAVVDNKTAAALIVEPQWVGALPVNRTVQMKALLRYSDNSTFDITDRVTWTSNDTAAATVNNGSVAGSKGLVTALSTGGFTTKRVSISANDSPYTSFDSSATIDITAATIASVNIETTSDDSINSIPVGFTRDFYAMGNFSDGSKLKLVNPGAWTASDPTLVSFIRIGDTVSVRALAPGAVTVSYVDVLADGSKSGEVGSLSLTVTDASLTAISVMPTSDVMPVQAQAKFEAEGTFAGGLIRDITNDVIWDSSTDAVAVFGSDRGSLTSLTVGSTNVTAQGLDGGGSPVLSNAVNVAVQNESIQTLQINDLGVALAGEERGYSAIATFTNSVTADYTDRVFWSSSNVEIATVSNFPGSKGRVIFIKAGQVNLNAVVPGVGTSAIPLVINVQ